MPSAVAPLEQLAASRAERDQEQAAAAAAQSAANQAELDARAASASPPARSSPGARPRPRPPARSRPARPPRRRPPQPKPPSRAESAPAPAAAPAGSYQDYALAQLGGDANEFSCLESLWGRESGWNPNAQNPTSTAYGIPQFLDSTWAGTGIAKTSDGYRQIDAGLIYIKNRYGSPCGAWGHSQANDWY